MLAELGEPSKTFDVICVGEATWRLADTTKRSIGTNLRLRPSSGAINVAVLLRKRGLRVGLATVLDDDAQGRATRARIAATGVEVDGVTLASAHSGRAHLVLVDARGDANEQAPTLEARPPFQVPEGWSSPLMFLSGITPIVPHAAALCRAARRARRSGALVLIDFNASLHTWAGRDARTIRMLLREVDVARCSTADLAVIGVDAKRVQEAMRPGSTLVVGEPNGRVTATGSFGDVTFTPEGGAADRRFFESGAGDALMASICREMASPAAPGESAASRWHRALCRAT